MKQSLWAALAVLLGLCLLGQRAFAGGYGSDVHAGTDVYVARAHAPIYDCPNSGCQTNIRLRSGSSIYAVCWDGGEGWCRVQTRYFQNMFVPRYALDLADGGYRYRSYYYGEAQPRGYRGTNGCYYRDRYYYKGRYSESCYERLEQGAYRGSPYRAYSVDSGYRRPQRRYEPYPGGYGYRGHGARGYGAESEE